MSHGVVGWNTSASVPRCRPCGRRATLQASPSPAPSHRPHPSNPSSRGHPDVICAWSGTRLATEAEWEYAASGGLERKRYPWGDEPAPDGRHACNIWRGTFPTENTAAGGYRSTAPVDAFEPNGFGLYNAVGNVWDWCADRLSPDFHVTGPRTDPAGPPEGVRGLPLVLLGELRGVHVRRKDDPDMDSARGEFGPYDSIRPHTANLAGPYAL